MSIGYAIPSTDFDANIHSVFSNAVNLKPANKDLLLTVVVADEADLPQGIRVNSPDDFSFEQLIIGRNVFCRDNILFFENSAMSVDFYQSRRWQCDLSVLGTDLTNPVVTEIWRHVWKLLNERQVHLGAEIGAEALLHSDGNKQSAISCRMGEAIRSLIGVTRNYRLDDLSALAHLIGLGTGLTPCGDDFLVGYLAGLWCTLRDHVERRQFVSDLGQAIIHRSGRTKDISRTYLYHAAYGQVSSHLHSLAEAISKPESQAMLQSIAESAMHSGHTSGMDAVTGLLFGLATWEDDSILAIG